MADIAVVMQSQKNGVVAFLERENPYVISLGCFCHLIYLATEKGVETLPCNIEEISVDIYYCLKKSSKHKELWK